MSQWVACASCCFAFRAAAQKWRLFSYRVWCRLFRNRSRSPMRSLLFKLPVSGRGSVDRSCRTSLGLMGRSLVLYCCTSGACFYLYFSSPLSICDVLTVGDIGLCCFCEDSLLICNLVRAMKRFGQSFCSHFLAHCVLASITFVSFLRLREWCFHCWTTLGASLAVSLFKLFKFHFLVHV